MLPVTSYLRVARGLETGTALAKRQDSRFGSRSDRASVVVWNVCHHCQMSCPHCYATAGFRPSRHDLSDEEAKALIAELREGGVQHLIFSGGEPLLREGVVELMAFARSVGLVPHLSSNGVRIDAPMAAALKRAGVAYAGVSIDGGEAFNDAYRGLKGGYSLAVRGLSCAREAGISTGLRMTLTRRNAGELEAVAGLARALPVDRFYVSHLVYAGRARRIAGEDLSPEETRSMLHALFDRADGWITSGERTEVVTGGNDSDGPLLVHWIRDRHGADAAARVAALLLQRGGNSAGETLLNIDHRGEVHPDQFWTKCSLGNVRERRWSEILAHPLRAELRDRESRLTGSCAECVWRGSCRGSHRERALAVSGELFGPDPSCVLSATERTTPLSD